MSGMFRLWSWQPSPTGKDPELQRLENDTEATRDKINRLREHGRLLRAHRLESLDALETRRMTLQEILKRMEKELAEKKVDDYADVLAEAFGERVIYAHRAIGMEALLCQFMHQMLAKQHQLKILKRTGKDLLKLYQNHRNQNREEFHAFEALAVHLETMRLSLEAQYDDIFAAQHSLLARLHHVEAGGTMTNYKIVKQEGDEKEKKKPTLTVSSKHDSRSPDSKHVPGGDSDDDEHAVVNDILAGKDFQDVDLSDERKKDAALPSETQKSPWASMPAPPRAMFLAAQSIPQDTSSAGQTSARNRRREIEQKRLAAGRGSGRSNTYEDPDLQKARDRLRALEASRVTREASRATREEGTGSSKVSQLRESTSLSDDSISPEKQRWNDARGSGILDHEGDEVSARREKRRSERTASQVTSRVAPTAATT
jgi:hypothetical protein